MPFCTVAACFPECETRSACQQKVTYAVFVNETSGICVMQTPSSQGLPYFYACSHRRPWTVLHRRLWTELWSDSPWLYYDVSIVPLCLFVFSIHPFFLNDILPVILYKDDNFAPRTNGVRLRVRLSSLILVHMLPYRLPAFKVVLCEMECSRKDVLNVPDSKRIQVFQAGFPSSVNVCCR